MSPTFEKGSAVMAAYGDVTTNAWAAIVIGAVELVVLAMMGIAAVMRWRRSRHDVTTLSQAAAPTCREPQHEDGIPYWRCHDLIAEALIVRDRVAGHIDAVPGSHERVGLRSTSMNGVRPGFSHVPKE